MSWLNNFKISFKVSLIVVLMAIVTVGTAIFATHRMRVMDDANTDIVTRVDKSTTMAVRASRNVERYLASTFELLTVTTDADNARLFAQAMESKKAFETMMAQVVKDLPEKASIIGPVVADYRKAFAVCDPIIQYAAKAKTPEENLKAAARLNSECTPNIETAISEQTKLTDSLLASSAKVSDDMTDDANFAIRMVWICAGVGLLVGLAIDRKSVV